MQLQNKSMIHFFKSQSNAVFVLQTEQALSQTDITKLEWLFGGAKLQNEKQLNGFFVGPRAAMITPWSTNAVEITQTMGLTDIERIEEFFESTVLAPSYDRMLQHLYDGLNQDIFTIHHTP